MNMADRQPPAARGAAREPIHVAAAVLEHGGRVLIAQRKNGRWEFPGGKIEPGETAKEALARELKEELGLTVLVGDKLTAVDHLYPDRRIILHTFSCRLIDGRPRAIDCQDWRWAGVEELPGFDFLEADLKIVDLLAAGSRPLGRP